MDNELKNSINFINKKIGQKSGFSSPTNYFDNLEEEISVKIVEDNFDKERAFNVPELYFKGLEDDILTKVSSKEKEPKIISFKNKVLKLIPYAAAACIALFIGLNTFVFNASEQITIDNISDIELEYWLDTNTINTIDITEILENEIFEENDFSFTEIQDESIEDYINSIDNTSILNELN
mmetsp:Transcript_19498/g.22582  ORF Transcript_19498/g.22582 Transcript_19498/m.22582 type:complete len:180 (+) Transcript_19498:589-1128(+)